MRFRMVLAGVLLAAASMLLAQSSGGPYVMRKDVVAGGGGASSGGGYRVVATLAQPVAAVQSGGSYVLTGGFHGRRPADTPQIFCDGFEDTPCP